VRAQRAQVPIILGSATPSLETLENAAQGRYEKHLLPQRPGGASAAHDFGGFAPARAEQASRSRHAGNRPPPDGRRQVIVFLNRRGYAPSLFCNACGWVARVPLRCAHDAA